MKLIVLKSAFRFFPEVLLTLVVLYYWSSTGTLLNPIAIALLILLAILFIWNNKILGATVASLVLIATLYISLAIFSDLIKIDPFYPAGLKLLVGGIFFVGISGFSSIWMLIKHTKKSPGRIILQ